MKYFIGAVSVIVIMIVVGLIVIYSGIYNFSAMVPHNKMTLWVINKARDNSIKYHANNDLKAPNLSDSTIVKNGFMHYRQCIGCHGAPGIERGKVGGSLYPRGAQLSRAAEEWSPQQLFWIIKNGLKMTGMPAFGKFNKDEDIWSIVAFTKKLPSISKEQFQAMDNEFKVKRRE